MPQFFCARRSFRKLVRAGLLALTLLIVWPAAAPQATAQAQNAVNIELADGITDKVLGEYRDLALIWDARIGSLAIALFFSLLTLQGLILFGRSALNVLSNRPVPGLQEKTIKFMIFCLISSALLFSSEVWVEATYNTFLWGASVATQQEAMASPGTIAMQGFALASAMGAEEHSSSARSITDFTTVLGEFSLSNNLTGIAGFVVLLSFIGIAVQVFITQAAFFLSLGVAPFFLSWGALQYTAGFADGFLRWLAYISVKMFILYMLIGVASDLPMNLAELYNQPTPEADAWGWIGDIPGVGYAEDYYEYVSYRTRIAMSILVAVGSTAATVIAIPRRMADYLTRGIDVGIADILDF